MISQNRHVYSEESLEKQMRRKAGCCSSNTVVISYTKRMITVVRDFPKGCGPWGRFATQCCPHVVQSVLSSSSSFYDSSDSEDMVVLLPDNGLESVLSKEVERKDVPQVLDTTNPIDLLKTSDHEVTELPEGVVSKSMPKGYKPHKRVVAIRDYPIKPRRFQPPFAEDLVQSELPDSSPKDESKSVEDETPKALDDIKQIDLEVTSKHESKEVPKEAELAFSSSRYDLESEDSIVSMYNISLNSFGLSEDEAPKALDDIERIDLEVTSKYETKELSKEAELELSSSRYDLESEDSIVSMYNISLNSFGLSEDEEGIHMPKVTHSITLMDQSEASKHESTDLTEEIESNFTPPVLPPNTIHSTTSFLKGCPRRGLNHKLSDAEDPLLEVLSDLEESCSTNACKCNLQESENLSGQCSNQVPEKCPNTTERPVPKLIVTALIAAPTFPWSKNQRASGSNTIRDTNKRKRKKH